MYWMSFWFFKNSYPARTCTTPAALKFGHAGFQMAQHRVSHVCETALEEKADLHQIRALIIEQNYHAYPLKTIVPARKKPCVFGPPVCLNEDMDRREVDLNELPAFSPWPERLLGLAPWTAEKRTIQKVEREYDAEKYLACLKKYQDSGDTMSMQEMKEFELGSYDEEICASLGDRIYADARGAFMREYYERIASLLAPHIRESSMVAELGAGYGYNLWMLKSAHPDANVAWLGGEYSANGVLLANKLAHEIGMEKFDFYDMPYKMFEEGDSDITIFTVFGVHQLPSAAAFIEGLRPYKDRIRRVINIESVYEFCDTTLLGHMRKRYIEMCDYNTDLYTLLSAAPDIDIIDEKRTVMGLNPLLPMSVVEWEIPLIRMHMKEEAYTVAIVGAGRIGCGFDAPDSPQVLTHAHAFSTNARTRLVGIVDADQEKGSREAARWKTTYFPSVDAMYAAVQPDIVVIATPDDTHLPMLRDIAALKPRLIICEKPVIQRAADVAAAEAVGGSVPVIVNYRRRFDPAMKVLADDLTSGRYGDVLLAHATYTNGALHNGSHMMDLLRMLFGEVKSVQPLARVEDGAGEPSVGAFVTCERCPQIYIGAGDARAYAHFELEILTQKGRIRLSHEGTSMDVEETMPDPVYAGFTVLGPEAQQQTGLMEAMSALAAHAAEVLDGTSAPRSTLKDALTAESLCLTLLGDTI